MPNDSTTAGFITSVAGPTDDVDLDDQLHSTIHGIVGVVDPSLVRPRWQPNPPNQPNFSTDWIAFGVLRSEPDVYDYQVHVDDEDGGVLEVQRDELLFVQVSFFGPNAARNDSRLRAGLAIGQNRAALRSFGLGLVEYQAPTKVPSLLKETWVPRVDSTLVLRRRVRHTYQVRSLNDVAISQLDNEEYLTPLKITPP